ncbi:hypothetical protein [Deinococcus pimensis]|uniref:hypothetical protein n=1 Tax=Deinococcus pimensis TaxID=309888 RepID=UPI00047FD60A|nr:hypothetical protein [Deinococcus pimensis]
MATHAGTCPLSQTRLLDDSFMEHRAQVLAVAAFLDRLDRSRDQDAGGDFRLTALREALHVLTESEGGRVGRVQMLLSDRDVRLLEERDRQNALGASGRAHDLQDGGEG